MQIRELSEREYQHTFSEPMRRLAADDDPPVQVSLKDYLTEVIRALSLPTTVDAIELDHVYVGDDDKYTHVVFNYGIRNQFLVVVVDNGAQTVFGHRLLALT